MYNSQEIIGIKKKQTNYPVLTSGLKGADEEIQRPVEITF